MQLNYSGDLLQTIVFPNRKDDIAANFNAADRFISALGPSTDLNHQLFVPDGQKWNGHLWRDVSALSVIYIDAPPTLDSFVYAIARDQDWYHQMAIDETETRIQHLGNVDEVRWIQIYEQAGAEGV